MLSAFPPTSAPFLSRRQSCHSKCASNKSYLLPSDCQCVIWSGSLTVSPLSLTLEDFLSRNISTGAMSLSTTLVLFIAWRPQLRRYPPPLHPPPPRQLQPRLVLSVPPFVFPLLLLHLNINMWPISPLHNQLTNHLPLLYVRHVLGYDTHTTQPSPLKLRVLINPSAP